MQVLKLKRKTQSKIELVSLIIRTYCIFSNIEISDTAIIVLSYCAVYGFKKSTKDLIVRSQILKSYNSIENTLTKLRKVGLIKKTQDGNIVITIGDIADNRVGLLIELSNV